LSAIVDLVVFKFKYEDLSVSFAAFMWGLGVWGLLNRAIP